MDLNLVPLPEAALDVLSLNLLGKLSPDVLSAGTEKLLVEIPRRFLLRTRRTASFCIAQIIGTGGAVARCLQGGEPLACSRVFRLDVFRDRLI